MAEKVSVRVPLTARQKAQIRNATGKTINAFKVETAGGASPKMRVNLAARMPAKAAARRYTAKLSTKVAARYTGKSLGKSLG